MDIPKEYLLNKSGNLGKVQEENKRVSGYEKLISRAWSHTNGERWSSKLSKIL
jgi:hypothetical protein